MLFTMLRPSFADVRISLECRNMPLEEALKMIQEQARIEFVYDAELLLNKQVSCVFNKLPLEEAIATVLSKSDIRYQLFPPKSVVFYQDRKRDRALAGIVVDRITGKGLPQANVHIKGTGKGTASGSAGDFMLRNLDAKLCTLSVCYIGYRPVEFVTSTQLHDPLTVAMDRSVIEMEPVDITDSKIYGLFDSTPYGEIQFLPSELKRLPTAANGDILQLLQSLPCTKGIFDQLDGLYVQGGTPDQNQVLFDGIPVVRAEHLWGYMNAFNPESVSQVHLHKAGFPSNYGDKLSSIIELEGNAGGDQPHAGIGADFFSTHAFVQLPCHEKIKCAFSGRRSFHQIGLKDMAVNMEDYLFLIKRRYLSDINHGHMFAFWDGTGKIEYQHSPETTMSLTAFATYDKIDIARPSDSDEHAQRYENWSNQGIGFNWKHRSKENHEIRAQLNYSGYANDYLYQYHYIIPERSLVLPDGEVLRIESTDVFIEESDHYELSHLNGKLNYTRPFTAWFALNAGIDIERATVGHALPENHYKPDGPIRILEGYQLSIALPSSVYSWKEALYINHHFKFFGCMELIAGGRSVYYEPMQRFYPTLRMALLAHKHGWTFHVKWGSYYQFLHRMSVRAGDFNPMRTSYYWAMADKDLVPSYSEHWTGGIDFNAGEWSYGLNAYYKTCDHILFLLPTIFREDQNMDKDLIYIDQGASFSKALEIYAQKKFGWITGWVSYQTGKSLYRFASINQGRSFFTEFDRTHEINGNVRMIWRGAAISFSALYATGTPFSTAEHTIFGDAIEYDFIAYCNRSVIKNSRLPDYLRCDVKLSHLFEPFRGLHLEYGATIYNLFNRKNIIDQYYRDLMDMNDKVKTDITEMNRSVFLFVTVRY